MSGDVVTESGRDRAQCASVGLGGEVPGGSSRIFISYRREETAFPAGWLYDRLNDRFGEGQVFKDVDSITLGDDFVEVITRAVGVVRRASRRDRRAMVDDDRRDRQATAGRS